MIDSYDDFPVPSTIASGPAQTCGRAPKCALDYQLRISGPLFDRIDCHVEVPAVSATDLSLPPPREDSATVASRIAKARAAQAERCKTLSNDNAAVTFHTNAEADGEILEKVTGPNQGGGRFYRRQRIS